MVGLEDPVVVCRSPIVSQSPDLDWCTIPSQGPIDLSSIIIFIKHVLTRAFEH